MKKMSPNERFRAEAEAAEFRLFGGACTGQDLLPCSAPADAEYEWRNSDAARPFRRNGMSGTQTSAHWAEEDAAMKKWLAGRE